MHVNTTSVFNVNYKIAVKKFRPTLTFSYNSSAAAEIGDRGHNRHGPLCPFRGEVGPCLIQCGLGRGLLPYQLASSSIQPFGHNRHEPKTGELCPFSSGLRPGHSRYWPKIGGCALWGRGAGSPSNTMWPGPRPTCVLSFISIHPTVWPQCTNDTDRQDRQDRTDRAYNCLIA